ncbi:MAG: choline-sulfatase [Verrucomicrobiales bacterium]|nr:choline-sulfatase [Verrucomicrobiales bacterium]
MKIRGLIAGVLLALFFPAQAEQKPNFLIIAIDDLNDYVGCLGGHPDTKTPNIDKLANQGILFTNAHCNSPVCNSSRASIWTGLRPSTTGITTNHTGYFRENPEYKNLHCLPQTMQASGYSTTAFGKVYHLGAKIDASTDWQQLRTYRYGPLLKTHLNFHTGDRLTDWGVLPSGDHPRIGMLPSDPEAPSFDEDIARRTIEFLGDSHNVPFFLGCGFFRPHTPLYSRKKHYDRFPIEEISIPEVQEDDIEDLPYFKAKPRREQDIEAPGLWNHQWITENGKWKDILQAYFAAIASTDDKVGEVMAALQQSEFSENTYVILFSDHGWNLGEKEHWGKAALWEQTTRVPFIIYGPGIPAGIRCSKPVELLSIYPTVLDYAGIEQPHSLEGVSLRPLLEDPESEWDHPALTTFSDHHALRTERWRYIRYVDGSEELYDHDTDPNEWSNLSQENHPELPVLRRQLEEILTRP